ncbi:MAG: DUF547 domain-containing protein [Flavobacteriaceae bacterium]|nr:DUF547 domain-containing protein [Flavobacteriaceae bacterium]
MKLIFIYILGISMSSCFSNQGLPVKQVTAEEIKASTEIQEEMVDHSAWDELLKKHVMKNGDVDYRGFKNDSNALNDYVNYLASQVPQDDWSVQEQLAYFINVYNANVIKLIVDNYPTGSIKDISNPWLKERIKVGNKDFSLAGIEKGVLQQMNEPRIHFAINCASISCPKLLDTAYTANNVMQLMDQAATEFINNPEKNKISKNNLKISEIFKWYESDFTANGGTIIDYLNKYSKVKIQPNTPIDYIEYNWGLNDI